MGFQINTPQLKSKWTPWLPQLLVLLWLLYLGITIWHHAASSVQPPLYDSLTYLQKAYNFWRTVGEGKFFNPLNIEPTVRPPGTILMAYPFGFTSALHAFYFRSVYLPILFTIAAVYIVAGTIRNAAAWWIAAIAMLFSSLPMFYHFEWIDPVKDTITAWGLVDNFQAGIAALAAAAIVRSLSSRSLRWLLCAALLATLTLLVKPSGLMVMLLLALTWTMLVVLEWRQQSNLETRDSLLPGYAIKGSMILLVIYVCVTATCFASHYLSGSNFVFAKQALATLKGISNFEFHSTLLRFHRSSGAGLLLWVAGIGTLFVFCLNNSTAIGDFLRTRMAGLLVASLLTWGLGAWYWLVVQSGITQIRYFYPFMLMGAVYIVPVALFTWEYIRKSFRPLLMAVCILPTLNIAGLMVAGDSPPTAWQKLTGVDISVSDDREEVAFAYKFLGELKKTNSKTRLYSFCTGLPHSIFENVGTYEAVVRQEPSVFIPVIPFDWVRGFAVRMEELLDCEYILVGKKGQQDTNKLLAQQRYDSFQTESLAFSLWFLSLNDQSGVTIVDDCRSLRLLRIVDKVKLNKAMEKFVAMHSWRPEFLTANQATVPIWWRVKEVQALGGTPAINEVGFEGIYQLHELRIERVDIGLKIYGWWEELRHEEQNKQRILFLHLIDSAGNILYVNQIPLYPYSPYDTERRWRRGEAVFPLKFPAAEVKALGFGVYHVNGTFLLPDKGVTDLEGRRLLLPLASFTGAKHATEPTM